MGGRILPAAYATLATSIAVSARAWSPLVSFFEKAIRTLVGSWSFGHVLTKPLLYAIAGLPSPAHAAIVARVRLVSNSSRVPHLPSFRFFEAAWKPRNALDRDTF